MLRMILLAIVFSIFFIGCGSIPEKPNVPLCTVYLVKDDQNEVDYSRSRLICAYTQGLTDIDKSGYRDVVSYIYTNKNQFQLPLSASDKYIAFSPDSWEDVSVYMKDLRNAAQKRCQ